MRACVCMWQLCVCLWAHLSIHPSVWLCVCVFSVYVCVWIRKSCCLCLCGSVVWVYLSVFPSVTCLGAANKRPPAWLLPYDFWTCSLNHCLLSTDTASYFHHCCENIIDTIYICWINISEGPPPGPALWEAPEVPKRGPRMWEKLQAGIFLSWLRTQVSANLSNPQTFVQCTLPPWSKVRKQSSELCCYLAVWPWVNPFLSLSLSFPIC